MPHTVPPQSLIKFEMTDELLAEIERADQQQSQNQIAPPAPAPHPYTSGYPLRSESPSPPKDPNVERIWAIERSSPNGPDTFQPRRTREPQATRESPKARNRQPMSPIVAPFAAQVQAHTPDRRWSPLVPGPGENPAGYTAQYSRESPPVFRRPSNTVNSESRSNLLLASQTPPLQAIARTPDRSLPIQEVESEDEFRSPSKSGPGAHESWKNNDQGVAEHNSRRPPPSPTPSSDVRSEGNSQRYDMNHTLGGRESRAGHRGEDGRPLLEKDQSQPARYAGRDGGEEEGGYTTRSPMAGSPDTPHDTFYHQQNMAPGQQARSKTTNGSTDGLGMRNLDSSAFELEQTHLDNRKSRKEWPQSAGKEDINLDALVSTASFSEAGDVLDVQIVSRVLSAIRKVMEDLKADASQILPADEAAAQLHIIFDLVFSIKRSCKTLLKCRGDDAKTLLNSLQWVSSFSSPNFVHVDHYQKLLDHPQSNSTQKSRLLSALLRLCRKSGLYPDCIILKNIVREDDCAVASGHFGEIWKGKFRDQQVCLKVVKIYKQSHVDHLLKVCSSHFPCSNNDFDFI